MRYIVCIFFITGFTLNLFSQQSEGGIPLSYNYDVLIRGTLKSTKPIGQIFLEPVNNEKEISKTDSLNSRSFTKLGYYGKLLKTDIDLINDTKAFETENGRLYLYHIFSPTACGLQFYFDNFHIAEGGRLFVYNEDKTMILGAFTEKNNNKRKHFGTQYITGNSVFLEFFEPYDAANQSSLHIDNIVHVFKPLLSANSGWGADEQSCYIDLACEKNEQWKDMGASVALILSVQSGSSYSYWCTGALLNNANNDGKPYFLSAGHCADTHRIIEGLDSIRFDISSWIFIFNYQKDKCNGTQPDLSNHSIYGAELLSIDDFIDTVRYYSDHLFLELNATREELEKYNVLYAGWDINEEAAIYSEYAKSIHHPKGNPKNISSCNMVYSGSMVPDFHSDIHWVAQWFEGITAFGSSGAPLFNDQYKIIGQLHGGGTFCDNYGGSDYYSKFSIAYDYGELNKWLDPENTNITSLDALDPDNVELHKDFIRFLYDRELGNIKIYLLDYVAPGSNVNLKFLNLAGQVLYANTFNGNILDFRIPDLTTGIYFLSIDYSFKSVAKKVFIF